MSSLLGLIMTCLILASSKAFAPSSTMLFKKSPTFRSCTFLREGSIEQIEFKIYPDGRIEETVRGIKGGDCHKVTEDINKMLGKTVDSKPTEELYEQEIKIEQSISAQTGTDNGNSWSGSSSW